jgi:ABC-type antimicrobial peptide transport system permease subunit
LSAIGVPKRKLLGSLAIQSTAMSLAAATAGTAAALLSASLALKLLPEFDPGRVGPPLDLAVPYADLVLAGVAVFLLLEAASITASIMLVRGVKPDLLRLAR